jgi:hypothetical protein
MQPSAEFCRAQAARHQALAAAAALDNVRDVALLAAAAWMKEAEAADHRERRREASRQRTIVEPPQGLSPHDRLFSENPDRGFADAEGDIAADTGELCR